jgi:hypothetical protein
VGDFLIGWRRKLREGHCSAVVLIEDAVGYKAVKMRAEAQKGVEALFIKRIAPPPSSAIYRRR